MIAAAEDGAATGCGKQQKVLEGEESAIAGAEGLFARVRYSGQAGRLLE